MDATVITRAMIESAGRALCDWDNAQERRHYEADPCAFPLGKPRPEQYEDWRDEYDARARQAIVAALGVMDR